MGTKVQYKSYLPGYHPMRDLNENVSSSWSRCYEDTMLSGHIYSNFMLRPVNEYSEYDKEMLKRTMLEHEATFRKQVYELHRLYRIQRDLMDECQKKGLRKYSVPSDTSQSHSFSSQMPCEGTKKIWEMSHLPKVNTSYDRATFASIDDMRMSLNFLKESNVQSDSISIKNGDSLKDAKFVDSKLQKFPRRMFDLQLPAYVYIDSEDSERLGKKSFADSSSRVIVSPSRTCGFDPENDVKLTLGTGGGVKCKKDTKVQDSWTQNSLSDDSLADLNKPIKHGWFQGAANSTSTHLLGLRTNSEKNQGNLLSSRLNTDVLGLQSAFSKDRHGDERSSSNFSHADEEEIRREWPFFNSESGQTRSSTNFFSPSLCDDKFLVSSDTIQPKLKNSCGIVLPQQDNMETWFKQRRTYGIETSGSTHLATSKDSAETFPSMPASFSILPQADSSGTAPSLLSSWTKPVNCINHILVAVQALPCYNGSTTLSMQNRISNVAIQNTGTDFEKWQSSRGSNLRPKAGSEAPSYLNGSLDDFGLDSKCAPFLQLPSITFGKPNQNDTGDSSAFGNSICHGPQKCSRDLQCTDVKSPKDVNLNQALPDGIQHDLTIQQHAVVRKLEQKFEESSKGIYWLSKKPTCDESIDLEKHASQMELGFTRGCSQLMSSSSIVAPESNQDKESGPSICNPPAFTSTLQDMEIGMQKNEISDSFSGRRMLGFPTLEKVQQSVVSRQECSLTNESMCIEKDMRRTDLNCDIKERSSEKPISTGSSINEKWDESIRTRSRDHINLNAELTCMDDRRLSELTPKSEAAGPLPLQVPRVSARFASEINLEAPISQAEGDILSHHGYAQLSRTDGSQETECSHDKLLREAAENIVAMSVDVHSHLEEVTCHPLHPAQWDALIWLAQVLSSNAGNAGVPRSNGNGGYESSDDNGLDSFEAMTLKLEEIKVDDCCCKPKEFENRKEGEVGAASLLLTRPRRGHARRRRQKRDFQNDILPGLASLSRHEVAEDLQTIGGLMKASGKSWKTGLTRRNTGRNGLHSQAKGRRQPRSVAATLSETQVSPPPVDPMNTDLEVDGRNMIGWGRTTRRCRRPRCPPTNVSAPLTVPYSY
ncbi:uncharacterized protein [Elaeis guineensis]|uniref:Uncharacterized protein LOC105046623 n=1 Tax=Elaeis guineensis var. tenera TaxID=51953 RepID=A0A6J0PK98_ELAGV|nr:uncharacterized protein LOC105046623 [Elaeis guineensis]XP_019706873.1 uncharacterized protein LOC105046623 [Elaeis guineensis]XP_019706874.1 uncharacterized protein LOC105046623 [Elaeis guineensis]XP_019706875.1 uncharacterized protein LOC105046623 [Elaeis guineensis]XP_019706876.1 uncharacterized protein LOC105046623 [Elaeis guineensis]XP_019706878.1 uncharacterized protein LOC105046623 [Elaeis guineensis]XP_029120837.1 uncharacterized protein LOC105046623 [Elaeis guineensis]